MRGMYHENLIASLSCGCGCGKKAEWLHARCHPYSGIKVEFTEKIMTISCYTCQKPIAPIWYDSMTLFKNIDILSSNKDTIWLFTPKECPTPSCPIDKGFNVRYNYQKEKIELYCNICKILISSVTLTKKSPIGS